MKRQTERGLTLGVSVKVRGNGTRSAFRGTVAGEAKMSTEGRLVVDIRNGKNSGTYLVPIEDVAIIRRKLHKTVKE